MARVRYAASEAHWLHVIKAAISFLENMYIRSKTMKKKLKKLNKSEQIEKFNLKNVKNDDFL